MSIPIPPPTGNEPEWVKKLEHCLRLLLTVLWPLAALALVLKVLLVYPAL